MKNQALFSSKYKSKKLKYYLLQYLFGPLRDNISRCIGNLQRGTMGNFILPQTVK